MQAVVVPRDVADVKLHKLLRHKRIRHSDHGFPNISEKLERLAVEGQPLYAFSTVLASASPVREAAGRIPVPGQMLEGCEERRIRLSSDTWPLPWIQLQDAFVGATVRDRLGSLWDLGGIVCLSGFIARLELRDATSQPLDGGMQTLRRRDLEIRDDGIEEINLRGMSDGILPDVNDLSRAMQVESSTSRAGNLLIALPLSLCAF